MTSIIKCTRSREYAKISNKLLQNNTLSLKARGLMAYILSLPDTWEICVEHLHGNASDHDGRTAVTSAMQELRESGYLHLERVSGKFGKLAGMRWLAFDDPAENPFIPTGNQVSRLPVNPSDGKPATIKETTERKEIVKKEILCAFPREAHALPSLEALEDETGISPGFLARAHSQAEDDLAKGKRITYPKSYIIGLARKIEKDSKA
jgi:hypothetical protein